ncbi:hypothetical protein QUC31_015275 [Theobroma cacao]
MLQVFIQRRAFKKFIDEMRLQQLFYHECRFEDEPSIRVYQLMKYGDLSERIRVEFHVDDENIKCSCLKFETNGIPCPHIIHVMILEQLNRIPLNLIMKRWTKNAKDDAPAVVDDNVDPKYQTILRYASLSSHCNRLCHVASQFAETFNKARSEIASLTRRYEEMCKVNTDGISNLTEHVRDPTRVKVKGKVGAKSEGRKKPRKCGNCRMEGHTRNKCPQLELTLRSLDSSSCLLDDNDVDVYERNKEIWPSQLGTLFGGDSSEV